jgi:hypothetical protein
VTDNAVLRAVFSLGEADGAILRALVSPDAKPRTFRDRLSRLTAGGLLRRRRAARTLWLYRLGPAGARANPGYVGAWHPSPAQLEHTLAAGQLLAAMTRRGFAAPLIVTGWAGEAELRSWLKPGQPRPDGRITWCSADGAAGAWLLELDRGTEARAAWRRKLVRYLTTEAARTSTPVLAATTSQERARNIAHLAADLGVPVLAATTTDLSVEGDPVVLDATRRKRTTLVDATTAVA